MRTANGTRQASPKVAWKINYWSVSCQKKVMNLRILISLISIFYLATNLNFSPDVIWRCMHAFLAYVLPLRDKPVSGISAGSLVSTSCIKCSFSAEETLVSSPISLWPFYVGFYTFQRRVNFNLLNRIRGDGSSSIFSLAIKEVPVDRSPLCRRKGESMEGLIA